MSAIRDTQRKIQYLNERNRKLKFISGNKYYEKSYEIKHQRTRQQVGSG